MYKKKYNLQELKKVIDKLISEDKKFIDITNLMFAVGYDPLDVNEFYIKFVKHRMRYERDK